MPNPYHGEEQRGLDKGPVRPSLGTPRPAAPTTLPTEPKWMPDAKGPRRKVFKALGRQVKIRMHQDF